jgi:ATP-dependent exoDNAse (exonuclease V) beta subunit
VIVLGLDKNRSPSLPDISLGYTDESRNDPLKNTYVRFFTKFQDASTNESFIETLNGDAHSTVENLLYVAMTRAREQLILPWPSFKEGKEGEFTFMKKLRTKCKMKVNADGIEMNLLSRDNGFNESVITAILPEDIDVGVKDTAIDYGRVAIEMMEDTKQILSQISPSAIEQMDNSFNETKLSSKSYGPEINLSGIKMEATDLGTILHHCYHVLLVDSTLGDRVFTSLSGKLPQIVWEQIQNQVSTFKEYCTSELQALNMQCEVPILSKTEQGSVVSGSLDLLVETDEGYWIIDHKSDRVDDFEERFVHHYPQLEAYVKCTKLDKPLLGIGINWVRYGKISLINSLNE